MTARTSPLAFSAIVLLGLAPACAVPASGQGDDEPVAVASDPIDGTTIVNRGEEWVAAQLHYCQAAQGAVDGDSDCWAWEGSTHVCRRQSNAAWNAYRSDCSGFVTWSWGLPPVGDGGYVTFGLCALQHPLFQHHPGCGSAAWRRGEQDGRRPHRALQAVDHAGLRRPSSWRSPAASPPPPTPTSSPAPSRATAPASTSPSKVSPLRPSASTATRPPAPALRAVARRRLRARSTALRAPASTRRSVPRWQASRGRPAIAPAPPLKSAARRSPPR